MKKLTAVILALILAVCAVPALALTGGWELSDVKADIPEEAYTAFSAAMEGFTGVSYEPVALLGTQVVAGINYSFLCKAQIVVPDAEPYYAIVCVYAGVDGTNEILGIAPLDLSCAEPTFEDEFLEATADEGVLVAEAYAEGDTVTVSLAANPTTGYEWTYFFDETAPLEAVSAEYIADASDEPIAGAGGTYTAVFKGTGEGSAVVMFSYSRSWEDEEPADVYALVLDIAADGTVTIVG